MWGSRAVHPRKRGRSRRRSAASRYWRARRTRAIQSMSEAASVRSGCWAFSDFSSIDFAVRALEFLRHHLAVLGPDHDAVAAGGWELPAIRRSRRRRGRPAPSLAGDLRARRRARRSSAGKAISSQPSPAGEPAIVEIAAGAGLGKADQRHRASSGAAAWLDQPDERPNGTPVVASALAIDSVDGQRARPCGVMLPGFVETWSGSRPARARAPKRKPARAASRSMAEPDLRAVFNHNNTPFPLTGAHTTVACSACYINNVYAGTPTDCCTCRSVTGVDTRYESQIHQRGLPDYVRQLPYNHGLTGATFNHTWFSTSHGGAGGVCATCHTNSSNYAVFTCTNCHTAAATNPRHSGVSGYVYNSTNCYACHKSGSGGGI